MTKEDAKTLVTMVMTNDVRNAFENAIKNGFQKYRRIKDTEDYSSLGEYAQNDKRRLLYSCVCSVLDGRRLRKVGFNVGMEIHKSSHKTLISNDNVIIDVFDNEHRNTADYQTPRFRLNCQTGGKNYIIICYYGDKDTGRLNRIMIRVYSSSRSLLYEEELWAN